MTDGPAKQASLAPDSTRLLVIRHGETAWNRERRWQGHLDIDLNARGAVQAASLGPALAHEPLDAVYASDLQRARKTAEGMSHGRGLPVHLDPALRERAFGAFEGMLHGEVEAADPAGYARWRAHDLDYGPPGGETLADFHRRVLDAVTAIARRHLGQVVAIVTHGGVLDCLYRAASGAPMHGPRTADLLNAAINRLEYAGGRLHLVSWGEAEHLAGLALDEIDRA
ncbi:histidine phosphatase family protein [Imbroritus primus]|uniref:Histidine phosphatase family protein n=1 Tax=Imbroritus primus TaxID=3058603 RepID=A0ACD3STH8_9BURK|nr:histidine phosphatase family protein [Burkholderiaceae bacterium PBA]